MTTRRKKINRRDFLKITGITLGGTVLAACGVQTGQPAPTPQPPPPTPAPPTATPIPSLAEQLSADPVALLDQDLLAALIRENPQEYQPLLDQMSQNLQQEPAWQGLGLQDFELTVLLINPDQNHPREWLFLGTAGGQTWVLAKISDQKFEAIRKPLVSQTNPDGTIKLKVDDLTLFRSEPKGGTYVTRMDNTPTFAQDITIQENTMGGKKIIANLVSVPLDSNLGIVTTQFVDNTMSGYDQDGAFRATYDFTNREWVIPLKEGQEYLQLHPDIAPIIVNSRARLEEGRITINFSSASTTKRGLNSIRLVTPGVLASTYETILTTTFAKYNLDPSKSVKLMGFYQDSSGISTEGSIVGTVDTARVTALTEQEFDQFYADLTASGADFIGLSNLTILNRDPVSLGWFDGDCLNIVARVDEDLFVKAGEEDLWAILNSTAKAASLLEFGIMAGLGRRSDTNFTYVYQSMGMSLNTMQTPALEFD